jgi:hypothetical protein
MNRNERTKLFFTLYLKEIEKNPDAKRYVCYLRAESEMMTQTGKRQYNKHETFKAAMSRAQKERRSLAANS